MTIPIRQLDYVTLVLLLYSPKLLLSMFPVTFLLSEKKWKLKNILTQQKPDAIFASDDLTAILVIKIAQELGISVPEELKVIGYDGTYFIENYYPQLATIKQPLKEIACLTVDLLLQKIEGKEVATTGYFLPVTLLPGKSI